MQAASQSNPVQRTSFAENKEKRSGRKLACHTEDQRSDSDFLEQRIRFWLDQSRATTAHLVTHSAADAPSSPSPQNLILEMFALRSGVRGANLTTLRPEIACRRRSSAPIRDTSFPCSAASWWRIERISSVIGLGVICIS